MAKDNLDLLAWLRKQLAEAEPDLLREMVKSFAEALMGAEADALCGAPFRERASAPSSQAMNRCPAYEWAAQMAQTVSSITRIPSR